MGIVGIENPRYATVALEFVPDTRVVHLLRVNPPRCSVATVSEMLGGPHPSPASGTDRNRRT
jgi:hypothetical protein